MRLLLLCLFALAIPALCSEPQVRQRRSVNGGVEYFIEYRANLNQVYNLVANASLTGASWALAKPVWQVKVDKSTVNSSPLQNAALTIQVDSSCGALHSITTMGVIYYNNQTMGTYTDFYNSAYSYQCPIGAWVYDPDNNVASVYFQMEVDTEQVPICPFTLQFATGSSPNPKCAGSHPTYPGGPTPPGSSSGGISNGAIAGIVIGVGCAVVLVFAVIILIRRRNQNTSEYSQPLTSQPQETGYQTNSGETEHTYNPNGPAHTSGHTYV